jgi:L-galactose dehydrogenase
MRYEPLGSTGLEVSIVSFGTAPLGGLFGAGDERDEHAIVTRAIDAGINLFDSSPLYGDAEERLGRALKGRRDEVIVATKAGRYTRDDFGFEPARLRESVERSLRLLQTDHVDILQLHDIEFVDLAPVFAEGYAELARMRDEGKCRFIGMTAYPTATLRRAIEETELDVVLCYAHFTLLDTTLTTDLLPAAEARGTGVMNAAAVALGLLTPNGPRESHPAEEEIRAGARRAREAAERLGIDIAFLANQYAIQRSGCPTTVIGTARPEHLDSAVRAATEPIDEEALAAVLEAVGPARDLTWRTGLPENA